MIQLKSLLVLASIYACGGTNSEEPKINEVSEVDNKVALDSQEKKSESIEETGPWPIVNWNFEGRKLELKQSQIEKGEGNCEYIMNARIYNWMSERVLRKKKIILSLEMRCHLYLFLL